MSGDIDGNMIPANSLAGESNVLTRQPNGPDGNPWVLPPFPGEMGNEVRWFLGRVEPYLRSGWKILARRPEFYPAGSIIEDQEYFAAEKDIFRKYEVFRWSHCVRIPRSTMPWARLRFIREWRSLFAPYLNVPGRPLTPWDEIFFKTTPSYDPLADFSTIVPPSYLPDNFTMDVTEYPDHVGVQLRYADFCPERNSDVEGMIKAAKRCAELLNVPLLVYGHPEGCKIPTELPNTANLAKGRGLSYELRCLRTCVLMIAPNSGWADLMAWLRVRTLVEREDAAGTFEWHRPFSPRMIVIDDLNNVDGLLDTLLNAGDFTLQTQKKSGGYIAALLERKTAWKRGH
jgi:hypothetical protein